MKDNAVTYSKGIAIMLMVLGHACCHTYVETWVNMFDIPAFYFLSGYCFKEKYLTDLKTFTYKRLRGIYWPYIKWMLFFLLCHNLLYSAGIYNSHYDFEGQSSSPYTLGEMFHEAIKITVGLSGQERLVGGYWFLPCLLIGSFIAYYVIKISSIRRSKGLFVLLSCMVLAVSMLINIYGIGKWIFNYRAFEAAFFILVGYAYKRSEKTISYPLLFVFLTMLLVTAGTLYWPGTAENVQWRHQVPFILTALCGSISLLLFCKSIEHSHLPVVHKVLDYTGSNTLTILTWHFSVFVFVSYIITLSYGLPYLRVGEFPVIAEYSARGWFVLYFLCGLLVSLFLASLNRYLPSSWLKL